MTTQSTTNRPVHTLRTGSVKAAIWKNEPVTGGHFFTITFSRSYQVDNEWRDTDGNAILGT